MISQVNFLNYFGQNDPTISVKAGKPILKLGQAGESAYLLKSGHARMEIVAAGERNNLEVTPGALLGIMGLIQERDYNNTYIAITDCELIPLTRQRAMFLTQEHPLFAFHIMEELVNRYYTIFDLLEKQ